MRWQRMASGWPEEQDSGMAGRGSQAGDRRQGIAGRGSRGGRGDPSTELRIGCSMKCLEFPAPYSLTPYPDPVDFPKLARQRIDVLRCDWLRCRCVSPPVTGDLACFIVAMP